MADEVINPENMNPQEMMSGQEQTNMPQPQQIPPEMQAQLEEQQMIQETINVQDQVAESMNLNIATQLSEEKLKEIGKLVRQEFDKDFESCGEHRKKMANFYKLFAGIRDVKNFPFENCCFHKDVEILTESGWKYVKDVKVNEKVFTREPITGLIKLESVEKTHEYNAPEKGLIQISNNFFDIQVTENHKFLLEDLENKYKKEVTAKEIYDGFIGQTNNLLPLTGKWESEKAETLYGYNPEDFLSLLGWFISEGWVYKNRCIGISQSQKSNSVKVNSIKNLLDRMGLYYTYNGISFLINIQKYIVDEFRELGHCDNKYIPRLYLELPPEQLKYLFDTLVAGDGSIVWCKDKPRNHPKTSYFTTSKKLADDFQELCLKLGFSASISLRNPTKEGVIRGKKITGKLIGYVVNVRYTKKSRFRKDRCNIEYVPYKDKVYCVTVPPFHTIYVRQNGKPLWTMNSNVHIPLMGIASLQFQSRAFEALLPSKEIAKCWSTDGKSVDAADRTAKYLNYQITDQMDEWEEEQDVLLLQLPIFGSSVKKTYWNTILQRPESRVLSIYEFVAPYKCKNLKDSPRNTHVFKLSLDKIRQRMKDGFYINIEDVSKSGDNQTEPISADMQEKVDKSTGQSDGGEVKNNERKILEQHRNLDLNGDGIGEPYIVTVDYETQSVLRISSRLYLNHLTNRTDILDYFTAYTFIPNPESWMGFGFGHLLEGLNEGADSIINQIIDSGTYSNVSGKTGFVSKRSGIKKGKLDIKLGQFTEIDCFSDDISKSIYTLKFPEPSQMLFALLGLLNQFAMRIASTTESMEGQIPPSDTPYSSLVSVLSEGLKVFSTIHKRVHRSFRRELKKMFFLNSLYLNEEEYFMVQDSASDNMKTYTIGRMDFLNNIDVKPASDPNITSKSEKLIKAKEAYGVITTNPYTAQMPEMNYYAEKMLLEAMDVDTRFLPEPKPQEPPDLTPEEENAGFIREVGAIVLPQQDHNEHLTDHDIFLNSMFGMQLSPQGKKLYDAHIKDHLAAEYLKTQSQPQGVMQ